MPTTGPEETKYMQQDEEASLWYFAIGSMMLPESCEHRHFYPQESKPAELFDFKMHFFGMMGYAEAVPSPGDSMHGVMHRVTPSQMKELDNVEIGYIRTAGKARPYDTNSSSSNQLVEVTVYCRPEEARKPEEDRPPQERYLEILIAGAEHHRVDSKYIDFLKNQEVQKRTPPDQFQSHDDPPSDADHYTKVPEPTPDGKLYFTLNGKLLEFSYPRDNRHGTFFEYFRNKYGPHMEIGLSQVAFDLKYGMIDKVNDMTPEHSAYLEDWHVRFLQKFDEQHYCKVLGKFSHPERGD